MEETADQVLARSIIERLRRPTEQRFRDVDPLTMGRRLRSFLDHVVKQSEPMVGRAYRVASQTWSGRATVVGRRPGNDSLWVMLCHRQGGPDADLISVTAKQLSRITGEDYGDDWAPPPVEPFGSGDLMKRRNSWGPSTVESRIADGIVERFGRPPEVADHLVGGIYNFARRVALYVDEYSGGFGHWTLSSEALAESILDEFGWPDRPPDDLMGQPYTWLRNVYDWLTLVDLDQ